MCIEEGKFILEGNKFYINGIPLYIKERKKDTEKKPKQYLMTLPFKYISSLFPVGGETGIYRFDFQEELWEIEIEEGRTVSLKKVALLEEV